MTQVSPEYILLVKNESAVDPSLLLHCVPHGWGLVCDFLCLVVLHQGQLCLPGTFLIVTRGLWYYLQRVGRSQGGCQTLCNDRTALYNEDFSSMSVGLRLRNTGLG